MNSTQTIRAPVTVETLLANILKWTVAVLIGWWMQTPSAFHALLALMLLDLLTGMSVSWINGTLNSLSMRNGLLRKFLTLIIILACHVIEQAAGIEFHLETIASVAYSINELISIVENAAKAGVPIPKHLVHALLAAKELRGSGRAERKDIDSLNL